MRKAILLLGASLAAFLVMGSSSALAAPPPTAAVCFGENTGDGATWEFTPAEVATGPIPGLPLSLSADMCVATNPNAVLEFIQGFEVPDPPTEPELPEEIPLPDPENPVFSTLELVDALCTPWPEFCAEIIGGVLSAPLPVLGPNLSLQGESGSCTDELVGTGSLSGGGSDFYSLSFTADYADSGGFVGLIDGLAEVRFGPRAGEVDPVSGVHLTAGCGGQAGGIVALLVS